MKYICSFANQILSSVTYIWMREYYACTREYSACTWTVKNVFTIHAQSLSLKFLRCWKDRTGIFWQMLNPVLIECGGGVLVCEGISASLPAGNDPATHISLLSILPLAASEHFPRAAVHQLWTPLFPHSPVAKWPSSSRVSLPPLYVKYKSSPQTSSYLLPDWILSLCHSKWAQQSFLSLSLFILS